MLTEYDIAINFLSKLATNSDIFNLIYDGNLIKINKTLGIIIIKTGCLYF